MNKIEYPSYSTIGIDTVNADQLSPNMFKENYWYTNKPVLIKGALNSWPSFAKWRNAQYLLDNIQDTNVGVRTVPLNQTVLETEPLKQYKFHDFVRKISEPNDVPIWLGSISFLERKTFRTRHKYLHDDQFSEQLGLLAEKDFGDLPFLRNPKAARIYPNWRVFIYKNMFTDWHAHPADTHLLGQLCGRKEVLLLPPNRGHSLFKYVREERAYTAESSANLKSKIENSEPIRVIVEEGDMLHIPVYWYHEVTPMRDDKFGISVVRACANPFRISGDGRFIMNQDIFDDTPLALKPLVMFARAIAFLQRHKPLDTDAIAIN